MKDFQAGDGHVLERQTRYQHGIQSNEGDKVRISIGNDCWILGDR